MYFSFSQHRLSSRIDSTALCFAFQKQHQKWRQTISTDAPKHLFQSQVFRYTRCCCAFFLHAMFAKSREKWPLTIRTACGAIAKWLGRMEMSMSSTRVKRAHTSSFEAVKHLTHTAETTLSGITCVDLRRKSFPAPSISTAEMSMWWTWTFRPKSPKFRNTLIQHLAHPAFNGNKNAQSSWNWAFLLLCRGGRIRTCDLLVPNQAP